MADRVARPGWARCSFVAQEAGDPLVGTAPPAQRWLLVEHHGPWGRAGFAGSGLDPAVVRDLDRWARSTAGRVVLIRRPGRAAERAGGPLRWFLADSRPGREQLRTGVVDGVAALAQVAAQLAGHPDDPSGTAVIDPLVLVCAHGRHDTCCAVRGRPIAAALAGSHPDATWECSHIGGCRFAPAVVLLPHGFVLGSVPDPATALDAFARYRAGTVDARHLRGRSSLPPAAQAAQNAARLALGADGVDDLVAVDVASDAAAGDGAPRWRVRLGSPDCLVRLTEHRVEPGRPLTCSATVPGWFRDWHTDGIDSAPGAST